jgi:hypothetical protein
VVDELVRDLPAAILKMAVFLPRFQVSGTIFQSPQDIPAGYRLSRKNFMAEKS